jgi:hypothetical protein
MSHASNAAVRWLELVSRAGFACVLAFLVLELASAALLTLAAAHLVLVLPGGA